MVVRVYGSSETTFLAWSPAPSTAASPARMRMVVEAKNTGLLITVLTMDVSMMRSSRSIVRSSHRRRHWWVTFIRVDMRADRQSANRA